MKKKTGFVLLLMLVVSVAMVFAAPYIGTIEYLGVDSQNRPKIKIYNGGDAGIVTIVAKKGVMEDSVTIEVKAGWGTYTLWMMNIPGCNWSVRY
jgi:hypothetical protein